MTTQLLTASVIATSDTDCLNPLYEYVPEDLDYIWGEYNDEPIGKSETYAHCQLVETNEGQETWWDEF